MERTVDPPGLEESAPAPVTRANARPARRRLPRWLIVLGFWSLIVLAYSTRTEIRSPSYTWVQISWLESLKLGAAQWYAWGLLSIAIYWVNRKLPFRPDAVKVIVLITDEPADQHQLRADDMIDRLAEREMLAFVASPPHEYFKRMAQRNGGKWYKISAHTRFDDLLDLFRDLARKVSQVVFDVYQVGDGSVADYLRLKPPEK